MNIAVNSLAELGSDVTLIDVSTHTPKAEIRGAIRYRPDDLLCTERLILPLASDRPVVVYDDADGAKATEVALKLRQNGYNASVLEGGLESWREGGGATQETSLEQKVPPSRPEEQPRLDRRL